MSIKVFAQPEDAGLDLTPKVCPECAGTEFKQTAMLWFAGKAIYECGECKHEIAVDFPSPVGK